MEVTGPNGHKVTILIDNTVPTNRDTIRFVDAKFSQTTDLTTASPSVLYDTVTRDQKLAYTWISKGEQVTVVPQSPNATAAGLTPGKPIRVEPTIELHVNEPEGGIAVRNF
jgi:hypothetical protein